MTTNNVKKVWASGKAVVNAWLAIPSGFSAEVIAQCGFDSVTVDMQHGVQDYLSMVQCFQAMNGHPVTPMVRVPWNEPGIIGKVLDGGAYGVICPMVNTKEQCEALVSACRYPPKGTRSNGCSIPTGSFSILGACAAIFPWASSGATPRSKTGCSSGQPLRVCLTANRSRCERQHPKRIAP